MQQWNFTTEYELARNTAVRASYIGNKGTHLERNANVNEPIMAPGPVHHRRQIGVGSAHPWVSPMRRIPRNRSRYSFPRFSRDLDRKQAVSNSGSPGVTNRLLLFPCLQGKSSPWPS